jgi:ABC-2 type transport system permease protein
MVACAAIAWVGSAVFAAFGLFMGYLLPAENVMQIVGPVLVLLAFAGGLFVPIDGGVFATIARFIPTYGLAELTRAPLLGTVPSGWAYVNVLVWGVVFVVGAAWRFRRDTARV